MDRILAIFFENEGKAYEGSRALQELQDEGSINLYAKAVFAKDADGNLTIKQKGNVPPVGTAVGLLTRIVVDLFGGAVGTSGGAGPLTTLPHSRLQQTTICAVCCNSQNPFIGFLELLGAICLIPLALTSILPILTPLAGGWSELAC